MGSITRAIAGPPPRSSSTTSAASKGAARSSTKSTPRGGIERPRTAPRHGLTNDAPYGKITRLLKWSRGRVQGQPLWSPAQQAKAEFVRGLRLLTMSPRQPEINRKHRSVSAGNKWDGSGWCKLPMQRSKGWRKSSPKKTGSSGKWNLSHRYRPMRKRYYGQF
jgi:hypothetical protein